MRILLLLFCVLGCWTSDYPPPRDLYTISWTGAPMVWPNAAARALYKSAGKFNPSHMVGTRFALLRDEVFLAFPRFLDGVCATLARTSLLTSNGEPSWDPFPSWEAQTEGDPRGLQNVVDLVLDSREVLWALDTGVTRVLESPITRCGPRVLGFDPSTGKRLHTIDLTDLTTTSSRLQYLVVDVNPSGQTFLFISDAGDNAIIVYNLAQDTGYRAVLPDTMLEGCPGQLGDILHLALVKHKPGINKLYLTYPCGDGIYSLSTSDLESGTTKGTLEVVADSKPGKMVVIGSDSARGIIYFRYEGDSNVHCWGVDTELSSENITVIHHGDSALLATHAVYDPLRNKARILLSNFLDFLRGSVGVGAVHVLRAVG